jgi:hypothetical protein
VQNTRVLEFAGPGGGSVLHVPLEPILRELFSRLAPGRPLAETPVRVEPRRYNWDDDYAYRTAEGDGLLVAAYCFGALPGDGVDDIYHLTIGDDLALQVTQGRDYSQGTFEFELSATAETIDVTTDALLTIAAARGLELVRRG